MKPRLRTVLSVLVFVMAAGLSYLAVTHRAKSPPPGQPSAEPQTSKADDTIAGIEGLTEGEVVALPPLKTLKGEPAALDVVNSEKFLLVFFTPTCAGCSVDAGLWKTLSAEATKRNRAFYLIDVGHDRVALDKFIEAYDLAAVPVLVSDGRSVGQIMKVNIVPQYLLIAKSGKVLHRWDGVRRFKQPPASEELAKFFQ